MIIFIHHSVNPYRVAFFNGLMKAKLPFKVYFLSKPAKNRKWKVTDFKMNFDYDFLGGRKIYLPRNDHSYFQLNANVWENLKKDNPDIIITIGWNYLATFIGFIYAKVFRKLFVIWSESTRYEGSVQRTLTLPIIKLLISRTDYFIASGKRAREYLVNLGAKRNNIKTAVYTID